MFELQTIETASTTELYQLLLPQVQGLIHGERGAIANAANIASLLYHTLPDVNWAGFYFLKGDELVLGPFHGKPACIRIPLGKGVCGAAAEQKDTIVVEDVHAFPGHIACDAASNSEIVVPLVANGHLIGVLDVDSPLRNRFSQEDKAGLEEIAALYISGCNFL